MVKSTSCFKIITCGGDAADKDDLEASEIKDSNDKRGWSFRKRSAGHRVLSNSVISETATSANKESAESTSINFQQPTNSSVVEKVSTREYNDEKPQLPTLVDQKASEAALVAEIESKAVVNSKESVVIVIQASIRGFMAQRELLKLKNLVKLQAAVRGHLVRRHAVGTLRCVQAIVKMQTLVRARHAKSVEGSYPKKNLGQKHGEKRESSPTTSDHGDRINKSNVTNTSIEKLLSNKFARQLLESTPKSKSIHVKCDPSKADSAWKWLERWMAVSSLDIAESKEAESMAEQQDDKDKISAPREEAVIQSEVFQQSAGSKPMVSESVLPSENEDHLITHADNFNLQACQSTSSMVQDTLEQPLSEKIITDDANLTSVELISCQNQNMASEANLEFTSLPEKPEVEIEHPKRSMKRFASDELETEGKKSVYGSRKSSNPAFIAAQSKFEELTSPANSCRSSSLSYQDAGVESQSDSFSFGADSAIRTKELSSAENSSPYTSTVKVGGSECGTELSISSTLDSPDRSEVGAIRNDHEEKVSAEGTRNHDSMENLDVETKLQCSIPVSNSSNSALNQPGTPDDVSFELVNSGGDVDSKQPEPKTEDNASDLQRELDSETVYQELRLSPEASPRSHITVTESQGTPSSQVSVKPKGKKTNKTGSNSKYSSLSAGKKSPSNAYYDSGSRGSSEQLHKDQKSGKRRSSIGLAKPDSIDQEPRDSSSNTDSLPRFMQATESARAKIGANNSPKSSPDVKEREFYIKKRHSLPGATGRQGSPRILLSMSQAQQGAKGNGSLPPHERKWQR
ncbi:Protein IQ-DOMAIN 32 [Quillaja saponaria]|uniref:Protein IQ-DOMAIN 32 n=1 Tax=Quillaja saponaria TaxID=32244 RepID=A0AAD7LGN0_QUISA|nr:Protein IQ-DOMAIN 32 [Quillaja saponaria]